MGKDTHIDKKQRIMRERERERERERMGGVMYYSVVYPEYKRRGWEGNEGRRGEGR